MSSIQKTFYSVGGTQYRLTISGSNITGNESFNLAANPVRLSFAKGKHKFSPLRTYQMKIALVTSQDLSSLYSDTPISTSVTLERYSGSSWFCEFYGYLEPLSFSQPYSGVNDRITLTAVDALTAYAFKYYSLTGAGVQYRTHLSYICSIANEIGATDVILAPCTNGAAPFVGSSPESAFLTPNLESGEATYADVIAALASLYGCTAMMVGRRLYFVNLATSWNASTYCANITSSSQSYFWQYFYPLQPSYVISDSSVKSDDMQISIEPPYGTVAIKPHGATQGMAVPAILRDVINHGQGVQMSVDSGKRALTYCLLKNTGIDWTAYRTDYAEEYHESDFTSGAIGIAGSWYGAVPVRYKYWNTGEDFSGVQTKDAIMIRLGHPSSGSFLGKRLFTLKNSYRGQMPVRFKVSCSVASRSRNDYIYPPILGGEDSDPSMTGAESGQVTIPGLYIKVGSYYYKLKSSSPFDDGEWSTTPSTAPMEFGTSSDKAEKSIRPSKTAVYTYMQTGWIGESAGQGYSPIEVYMETVSPNTGRAFWIFDFKIENYVYDNFGNSEISYVLNSNIADEKLTADVWFDNQTGSAYNSSLGNHDTLFNALKNRYRYKHRAIEFTGSTALRPFSVVTDGTNGNAQLTIDSMEADVANEKCRVYCS